MREIWKVIAETDGNYFVSNKGRVKSIDRRMSNRKYKGRFLHGSGNGNGYIQVKLGKHRMTTIHRLVLEAFVGPCPVGMECRHLNGKREDNWLRNLRWGTRLENDRDKARHGVQRKGTKLTINDVREIRAKYADTNKSQVELAKEYGVCQTLISKIIIGKRWLHVD